VGPVELHQRRGKCSETPAHVRLRCWAETLEGRVLLSNGPDPFPVGLLGQCPALTNEAAVVEQHACICHGPGLGIPDGPRPANPVPVPALLSSPNTLDVQVPATLAPVVFLAVPEPNDSLTEATDLGVIPAGQTATRTDEIGNGSHASRDVDLYRFTVTRPATFTLDVDAQGNRSPLRQHLRLFDEGGKEIACGAAAGTGYVQLHLWLDAGTCYAGVSGEPNTQYDPNIEGSGVASDSVGPYTLSVSAHGSEDMNVNTGVANLSNPQTFQSMILAGSARVNMLAGGDELIQTGSVQISDCAVLDLANNDLAIHATADTRVAVLGQVAAWIKSGYAAGAWNGQGICSSVAQGTLFTGLAVALNDKGDGSPIMRQFAGQSVGINTVLVRYSWNGDMNLNGVVNADDYFLIDSGFSSQKTGYQNGDLNYDGVVNADDYFLIDSAFIGQTGAGAADQPTPTPQQLAWQDMEFTAFTHFGMNTFTAREWGFGTEDPALFNPTAFDANQWVRVLKDAGIKMLILTAKHHDGFCLWPSAYTDHSVKRSPWRDGNGDVVKEVSDACRRGGIKFGIYLSPWDRHESSYGDSPTYNEYYKNQLRELLSNYGQITEVWLDGACGEGPNGKLQKYDWAGYYAVIRELQPNALIAIVGPDIRWVGNETGVARETEWSVQPTSKHPHRKWGWYPAECDVSIRPNWFYHPSDKVKSLPALLDIYHQSVGRNAVLLLNVPPDRRGLIAESDAQRLAQLRASLDETYRTNLAKGKQVIAGSSRDSGHAPQNSLDGDPSTYWAAGQNAPVSIEVDLGTPTTFNCSMIMEHIAIGQRVEEYVLDAYIDGAWQQLVRGTTIGHKKLDRFDEVTTTRVRLTILKSRANPTIREFGLYLAPMAAR